MTSTTASGWEIIETCEASISVILAPACSAIARRETGSMILSCRPMMAHDGMSFQAGGPDGSASPANDAGRCVAWITAASSGETSWAKLSVTVLGRRYVSTTSGGAPGIGTSLNVAVGLVTAGPRADACAGERDGRLALVRDERVDVDQALDVLGAGGGVRDDEAAVRMGHEQDGPVDRVEVVPHDRGVCLRAAQRVRERDHVMAGRVEKPDHTGPAGGVRPGAVDEDDRRSRGHLGLPVLRRVGALQRPAAVTCHSKPTVEYGESAGL